MYILIYFKSVEEYLLFLCFPKTKCTENSRKLHGTFIPLFLYFFIPEFPYLSGSGVEHHSANRALILKALRDEMMSRHFRFLLPAVIKSEVQNLLQCRVNSELFWSLKCSDISLHSEEETQTFITPAVWTYWVIYCSNNHQLTQHCSTSAYSESFYFATLCSADIPPAHIRFHVGV